MSMQVKITSGVKDLNEIKAALIGDPDFPANAFSIGDTLREESNSRTPLGFEPLQYFVVVFAAHLGADATKSLIKLLIAKFSKLKITITIEED